MTTKHIDAEKLYKKIDEQMTKFAKLEKETESDDMSLSLPFYYQGRKNMCSDILTLIDSLQEEQPDDLASLISEATNAAKRIVDWDSFYNSLPQNLRNKYTSKAWREILETLSTMKEQEQPEVNKVEKALSLQIQAYLTTASDELYAPGKPLYTKEHHEGIHECMKMWQKLHKHYFSTKTEQSEVDLEKEIEEWFDNMGDAWDNGEWSTNDIKETARHFYELGLNDKKEK